MEQRKLVEYKGRTRTIGLSLELVEPLAEEHAQHPGSPLMFMHPATQKPYLSQTVRQMHREILKEAGLDHIRFQDLRHTCAVLSLQNGMGIKEVAQMLGHFRAAMTRQNYEAYLTQEVVQQMGQSDQIMENELRQATGLLENLLEF